MKRIGLILASTAILLLTWSAIAVEHETETATSQEAQMNIVETAIAAGNFNTLVQAIEVAGLADTLGSPGPFTVFAPTDDAFAQIPPGEMDALLSNRADLTAVLTYHVVPGELKSSDLKNGMMLKTVEGQDLRINISDSDVMVNDAKVIQPDIMASNGVIHVIDTVLLPPAVSEVKRAEAIAGEAEGAVKETAEAAKTDAEETVAKAEEAAKPVQQAVPGFAGILGALGLLSVAFIALKRRG